MPTLPIIRMHDERPEWRFPFRGEGHSLTVTLQRWATSEALIPGRAAVAVLLASPSFPEKMSQHVIEVWIAGEQARRAEDDAATAAALRYIWRQG